MAAVAHPVTHSAFVEPQPFSRCKAASGTFVDGQRNHLLTAAMLATLAPPTVRDPNDFEDQMEWREAADEASFLDVACAEDDNSTQGSDGTADLSPTDTDLTPTSPLCLATKLAAPATQNGLPLVPDTAFDLFPPPAIDQLPEGQPPQQRLEQQQQEQEQREQKVATLQSQLQPLQTADLVASVASSAACWPMGASPSPSSPTLFEKNNNVQTPTLQQPPALELDPALVQQELQQLEELNTLKALGRGTSVDAMARRALHAQQRADLAHQQSAAAALRQLQQREQSQKPPTVSSAQVAAFLQPTPAARQRPSYLPQPPQQQQQQQQPQQQQPDAGLLSALGVNDGDAAAMVDLEQQQQQLLDTAGRGLRSRRQRRAPVRLFADAFAVGDDFDNCGESDRDESNDGDRANSDSDSDSSNDDNDDDDEFTLGGNSRARQRRSTNNNKRRRRSNTNTSTNTNTNQNSAVRRSARPRKAAELPLASAGWDSASEQGTDDMMHAPYSPYSTASLDGMHKLPGKRRKKVRDMNAEELEHARALGRKHARNSRRLQKQRYERMLKNSTKLQKRNAKLRSEASQLRKQVAALTQRVILDSMTAALPATDLLLL